MEFVTALFVLMIATVLAIAAVTAMLRFVLFVMYRGIPTVVRQRPETVAYAASRAT